MPRTSLRCLPGLLLAAAALGACATPTPAAPPPPSLTLRLPEEPTDVLELLRGIALARGYRITAESANSIDVDLGVSPCTVRLAADPGTSRTTEVHASARFLVTRDRNFAHVALVSLFPSSAVWHPDRRAWVPLPPDAGPGLELLTAAAGLP